MQAIFLSDAHIRDENDANLPPLLAFLDKIKGRTERIYILGDLFDTWYGFRRKVFPQYIPLLDGLEALHRAGTQITYVTGNHDYELGPFFGETLAAEIHDTEFVLEADGRRAFVAHGDMANPADTKYRRLRRILRARPTRWLGRHLPPSWVWRIAQRMTERYTGDDIARRMSLRDVFADYAAQKQAEGFPTVILGHLHIPVFEETRAPEQAQTYVNLGDWIQWRTFLRWDDGRLELKQWVWPAGEERPYVPERASGA